MNESVKKEIDEKVAAFRESQLELEDFAAEIERLLYKLVGVPADVDEEFREVANTLEFIRFTTKPQGWLPAVEAVLVRLQHALGRVP